MIRIITTSLLLLSIFITSISAAIYPSLQMMAGGNYSKAASKTDGDTKTENGLQLLMVKGRAYYLDENYKDAITTYKQVYNSNIDSKYKTKAGFEIAESYAKLKDFKSAEDYFSKALLRVTGDERKGKMIDEYFAMASKLLVTEDSENHREKNSFVAKKLFLEIIKLDPKSETAKKALVKIGECFEKNSAFRDAAQYYEAVSDTIQSTIRLNLLLLAGENYLKGKNYEKARKAFVTAMHDYPDSLRVKEAYYNVTKTYRTDNFRCDGGTVAVLDVIDANSMFIKRYPKDQRCDTLLFNSCMVALKNLDIDIAEKSAISYLSKKRDSNFMAEVRYALASLYESNNQYDESLKAFNSYIKNHPTHEKWQTAYEKIEWIEYQQVIGLVKDEKSDIAIKALDDFIKKYPNSSRIESLLESKLEHYKKENRLDNVLDVANLLTSKFPNNERGWLEKGLIYERTLETVEKAKEAFEKARSVRYNSFSTRKLENWDKPFFTVNSVKHFSSKETPKISVDMRNIDSVEMRIHTIDAEAYFRNSVHFQELSTIDIGLSTPQIKKEFAFIHKGKNVLSTRELTLPIKNAGLYITSLEGSGREGNFPVLISDLSVVTKSVSEKLFLIVYNKRSGAFVSDAKVLLSNGSKVIFEGKTNKNGEISVDLDKNVSTIYFFVSKGDQIAWNSERVYPLPLGFVTQKEHDQNIVVIQDKALYKVGDSVHLAMYIPKKLRNSGRATFKLFAKYGDAYQFDFPLQVSLVNHSFKLPYIVEHGSYDYAIYVNDKKEYSASITMMKDEQSNYTINITTDKKRYGVLDTITAFVKLSSHNASNINSAFRCTFNGKNAFNGETDSNGCAKIKLIAPYNEYTKQSSVNIDFDDLKISTSKHIDIVDNSVKVTTTLPKSTLQKGEELIADIRVTNSLGEPITRGLKIDIISSENHYVVVQKDVHSDDSGKVTFRYNNLQSGSHLLRVSMEREGELFFVEKTSFAVASDAPFVEIESSKKIYNPHDAFDYMVKSNIKNGILIVTVESDSIVTHSTKVFHGGEIHQSITLTDEMAPQVKLFATILDLESNKIVENSLEVEVSKEIKFSIGTIQEKYTPGEVVELTILSENAVGEAISAQCNISIADSKISNAPFSLGELYMNWYKGAPFYDFYTSVSDTIDGSDIDSKEVVVAEIRDSYKKAGMAEISSKRKSMSEEMLMPEQTFKGVGYSSGFGSGFGGVGDLIGGMGSADGVRLIKRGNVNSQVSPSTKTLNFTNITTDKSGKATVRFTVPEAGSGIWNISVSGVTENDYIGENISNIIIEEPVKSSLVFAETVTSGSKIVPIVKLENSSSQKRDVTVMLQGEKKQLTLTPFAIEEIFFKEIIAGEPFTNIPIVAAISSEKQTMNLSKNVKIIPNGGREVSIRCGVLSTGERAEIDVDPNRVSGEQSVSMYSVNNLYEIFQKLPINDYLYSAHESTRENFMNPSKASISFDVLELSQSKEGSEIYNETVNELMKVREFYQDVNNVKKSETSTLLLVSELFSRTERSSVIPEWVMNISFQNKISNELLARLKQLKESDNITRAKIVLALAKYDNKIDRAVVLQRLDRLKNSLTIQELATLGLIWNEYKRADKVREIKELFYSKFAKDFGTSLESNVVVMQFKSLFDDYAGNETVVKKLMSEILPEVMHHYDDIALISRTLIYAKFAEIQSNFIIKNSSETVAKLSSKEGSDHFITNSAKGKYTIESIGSSIYLIVSENYNVSQKNSSTVTIKREMTPLPKPYKDKIINEGYSTVNLENGFSKTTHVDQVNIHDKLSIELKVLGSVKVDGVYEDYLIKEYIPEGFDVENKKVYEDENGSRFITFSSRDYSRKYTVVAKNQGRFFFKPVTVKISNEPMVSLCKIDTIEVKSRDELVEYKKSADELYYLGVAESENGDFKRSIEHLEQFRQLFDVKVDYNKKAITALFFSSVHEKDLTRVVKYFELIKESSPELLIPFENLSVVQQAYEALHLYEAGLLLNRGIAEAKFIEELNIVGILKNSNVDLIATAQNVLMDKIDSYLYSAYTAKTIYLFTQYLYAMYDEMVKSNYSKNRAEIFSGIIALSQEYLGLYKDVEKGPQATYSLATAYLENDRSEDAINWCEIGEKRFPKSEYASSLRYAQAYAYFLNGDDKKSIHACNRIIEKDNEESRNMATYILAQIYHARGDMQKALDYYSTIQNVYQDAKDIINQAQRTSLTINEINTISGSSTGVDVEMINIDKLTIKTYSVDLMKLLQLKGTLSNLSSVNLNGITPFFEKSYSFDKKLGAEQKERVNFGVKKDGAYLAVVSTDDTLLHTIILKGILDMKVTRTSENSLRVSVVSKNGKPIKNAIVNIKGSSSQYFVRGKTDSRGIFIAEDISGEVTVIAENSGQYGLYRESSEAYSKVVDDNRYNNRNSSEKRAKLKRKLKESENEDEYFQQSIQGINAFQAK